MAKRRSREQIDADQIIKQHLEDLGQGLRSSSETSRRRPDDEGGRLQDEQNTGIF
jgi:hypothetical protein